MTARVHFYADQAFFSMVKRIIQNSSHYDKRTKQSFEPEESATVLVICHSACEAFLNIFAEHLSVTDLESFERKSILNKIEDLYKIKLLTPDWSRNPLQDIRKLDTVRNWLTHFKSANMGLINSMGQWVQDEYNKRPKIDDYKELNYERANRYYDNVREGLIELCQVYDCLDYFDYLKNENYNSYLIG